MSDVPTRPLLLVVTGQPGSGKTTLAHALAREIRCPAICRDEMKEGYVNTTGHRGQGGDDIAWHVFNAFFDAVELLLRRDISLVAEAAFQHKVWSMKLETLASVARVRIVICEIDPAQARARHIQRGLADPQRERYHDDDAVRAAREGREVPLVPYDPPRMNVPTLKVDTSDGYQPSLEEIVRFAQANDASPPRIP